MTVAEASLTKTELKEIVDRIFLMWNQQINPISAKDLYNGWWRILLDLEKDDVDVTIDELVIENGYMPRAGEVRRRTINRIHGIDVPSPIQAWQQFREAADASASGAYEGKRLHELVGKTVNALGGVRAYSLHTNGDREQFLSMYESIIKDYEKGLYALPQSQ
jgi:hypothetical protein